MRAELRLRWVGVSSRAPERAEGVGKRRCGSAGVAVRGQLQDYVLVRRASRFSDATLKADSDGVRADRAGD